jgi:hypothetical protein
MPKPDDAQPVGFQESGDTEGVSDDSLGTVEPADSTGNDREEESEDRRPAYERDSEKRSPLQSS